MTPLYYEAHVTVEPVFGDRLEALKKLASHHGFRVADLIMKKSPEGEETSSQKDSFCSAKSFQLTDLTARMQSFLLALTWSGFTLYRYKVEYAVIDSKSVDIYGYLQKQ